jgi:hypothetical protein
MNANMQSALSWLSLGVSPIPILPHSKLPSIKWQIWQDRLPNKKIIDYWFSDKNKNVGVICGGKSNLMIIDFDDIDTYYSWRKDMLKRCDIWKDIATKTYRVITSRGMHLYLKTVEQEKSRKYPDTKIDIRCAGNYTLVPPSIHPSGAVYEPIGSVKDIITVKNIKDVFPDIVIPSRSPSIPDREPDIFDLAIRSYTIAEIKSKIDIVKFVEQYSAVIKGSTDGRWWWARCIHPLHKDKHPSMRIDAHKGRIACQSTSCRLYHAVGYDVIDVYSIINNVDTKSAIKELSEIYL